MEAMTIQQLAENIVADRGPILLVFFVVMTLIQITPIKINPWSAIFKWLGKQLNTDVLVKMTALEKRIESVEKRQEDHVKESEKDELKARRMTILDFSSSILRGVNYHREKFNFMINECDSYEQYCKENDVKNGVAQASIAEIRRIYQEHLRNNDFLDEKSHTGK